MRPTASIQIGVLVDDTPPRFRPTPSTTGFFLAIAFAFSNPPTRRPGKAQQLQTFVGREQVCTVAAAGQNRKGTCQAGRFRQALSPITKAPIGVRLAGLSTNGQPTAIAGATL